MSAPEQTVFVVDDDEAVRRSLCLLLRSVGLNTEDYDSATTFLASLGAERGGCLLLDIRMPGMSGTELHDILRERGIALPVIFITGHGDVPMAVRAIKKGAHDFIQKPFNDQDLLDRVQGALRADAARRTVDTEKRDLQARRERLTPREHEILERIVAGQANKVIAIELGLSERTVELHRSRVMDKMQVRSVAELVAVTLKLQS